MIIALVVFVVTLITGLVMLSQASFLTIKNVSLAGNATISQEAVLATVDKHLTGDYLWLFPKRNIFLYPKDRLVETLLKQFATAKKVSIKRRSLQTIMIEFSERENNALWCLNESECFFLDSSGYVFAQAPNFSGDIYRKYFGGISADPIGQQYLSAKDFAALESFVTAVSSLGLTPKATYLTASGDYEIFLTTSSKIMLNQEKSLVATFINLEALWQSRDFQTELAGKNLDYIDLRFGNKVFYKLH